MSKSAWYLIGAAFLVYLIFPSSEKKASDLQQNYIPASTYSVGGYSGYGCTDDCSGHQAGYEWAELNDITDPDDCSGNSQSFIEGCQEYAEEHG